MAKYCALMGLWFYSLAVKDLTFYYPKGEVKTTTGVESWTGELLGFFFTVVPLNNPFSLRMFQGNDPCNELLFVFEKKETAEWWITNTKLLSVLLKSFIDAKGFCVLKLQLLFTPQHLWGLQMTQTLDQRAPFHFFFYISQSFFKMYSYFNELIDSPLNNTLLSTCVICKCTFLKLYNV